MPTPAVPDHHVAWSNLRSLVCTVAAAGSVCIACSITPATAGVGGDGSATAQTGSPSTGTPDGDADSHGGAPGDDTGTATEASGDELILDVAGPVSGGDGGAASVCEHVDAIFAFDVSGSMAGEIAAMSDVSSFAVFRDTLLQAGDGLNDFHLAVMDDAPAFPYYHDDSGLPDRTPCNFSTGGNYMISSSPAFADEYACLFANAAAGFTHVGDYGGAQGATPLGPGLDYLQMGNEMPARSAALSVSHPFALELDDGFLREEAVLFVLTISDEDDGIFVDGELDKDPPWPAVVDQMTEVHDRFVAAKGGDPAKVVFLGIGAASDGCVGPYGDTIRQAENLQFLVTLFEADGRGLFVDLCAGNLEQGIVAALEIVDESCDEFVPAG